ncbi:hypothetical protein PENDEC_c001G04084 [Penicillium decumbens]|uniref:FAS1 domain-containing protein n=1 Tax=Penicillium decumbens TaxID=69771 RepID=A0A1V6PND8_PENDC|nr:hypothetical protein PENDEC_c001G04084 [Penicillium decumbens]
MHFCLLLPVVASLCSALVIPGQEVLEAVSKAYLGLEDNDHSRLVSTDAVNRDDESDIESWWEMVSAITRNSHDTAADLVLNLLGLDSSFDGAVKFSQRGKDREDDGDDNSDDDSDDDDDYRRPGFRRPGFGRPSPDDSRACLPEMFCPANHTIWELINESSRASHLAELISDTDHLVNLLNSTVTNHTLFAPTNRALERLLDERPPNKLLKRIEHYHVIPGLFATDKLRHQHQTLRTALNESSLGENMPQRVIVNMRRNRLVLNRRSRIIAGNIRAQNGIIHHINIPLLPPPNTMTILDLLPDRFSTFALGLERTRLAAHFSKHKRAGGTTFAPTNAAFQRLGHRANAFLFSPQGEQCLRSLLQFHIVLNRTLYSDALYVKGDVREFRGNESSGSVHVKLPTVLRDHALNVNLVRRGPGVEVRVNGFYRVVGLDLLASDGVLHVLDRVLIPPKSVGEMKWDDIEEDIEAEELKERLGGCMEDQSMARMEL